MKNDPIGRFAKCLVLVPLLSALPAALRAQTPSVPVVLPEGGHTDALTALRGITTNRLRPDLFEDDSKLNQPLTLTPKSYAGVTLLTRLHTVSGHWMSSKDPEAEVTSFFVACRDVPARALMDGWATLYRHRWRRIDKKQYQMLNPLSEEAAGLTPNDADQAELFAAGADFFRAFDELPADLQQHLLAPSGAGGPIPDATMQAQSVPVTTLPDAMQQALRHMLEVERRSIGAIEEKDGLQPSVPAVPDQMTGYRLRIQPDNAVSYRSYMLTVEYPGATLGFRVALPQSSAETGSAASAQKGEAGSTRPDTYEPQPSEAVRAHQVPALERRVNVQVGLATLTEALRHLHEQYGLPFLTNADTSPFSQTPKKSLSLSDVPLRKAMDQLARLYSDDQHQLDWSYAKYGFLVLRYRERYHPPATAAR